MNNQHIELNETNKLTLKRYEKRKTKIALNAIINQKNKVGGHIKMLHSNRH